MLIERRLKLLSPLLAERRNNDRSNPKRVFLREKGPRGADDGKIHIRSPLHRWEWAFLEARDACGYADVATSAIQPLHYFSVSKTSSYNRRYKDRGHQMIDKFESLPSGQVFSMMFTLSQHIPPGGDGMGRFTRAPDEEEFDEMLSHIGECLGMSEWGGKFLYGRFEIKNESYDLDENKAAPKI